MSIESKIYQALHKTKNEKDIKNFFSSIKYEISSLIEGFPFGFLFCNEKGEILYINKEMQKYEEENIKSNLLQDKFPFLEKSFNNLLETKNVIYENFDFNGNDLSLNVLCKGSIIHTDIKKLFAFTCIDINFCITSDQKMEELFEDFCDIFLKSTSGIKLFFLMGDNTGNYRIISKEQQDKLDIERIFLEDNKDTNQRQNHSILEEKEYKYYKIYSQVLDIGCIIKVSQYERQKQELSENIKSIINFVGKMFDCLSEKKQSETLANKEFNEYRKNNNILFSILDILNNIPAIIFIVNNKNKIVISNDFLHTFAGRLEDKINDLTEEELFKILDFRQDEESYIKYDEANWLRSLQFIKGIHCFLTDCNNKENRFILYKKHFENIEGTYTVYTAISNKTEQIIEILARSINTLKTCNYIMSHDLSSPFFNIGNLAGLLYQNVKKKQDIINSSMTDKKKIAKIKEELKMSEDLINRISKNTESGESLVKDMLSFTRLDRKKEKQWCNPQELINNAVKGSIGLQEDTNTLLISPLPEVLAEKQHLQRIFNNLLTNTSKYRHPDRPLNIEIWCEEFKQGWEFHIKDNGIGIPEEHIDKIWDLFQSLDRTPFAKGKLISNSTEKQSNGVGLSIVKRCVEQHGGYVSVKSQPDKGSEFIFFLPREETMFDA